MSTIEKEVRFAVVMYGGVSLAIYMNGIAQELLTLVRSTARAAGDEGAGSATEAIYAEIARALAGGPDGLGRPQPVRFVIDILSGTSAGGINAVCLAKALTRGCGSLASLERIWLEEGDIDRLLNDAGSDPDRYPTAEPKTALLNSQRMFALLLRAFRDMESQASGEPLVDELDLYVTATDLRGINVPIRLSDGRVDERLHKHVFHFDFRRGAGPGKLGVDDDPMLAFASRCTSAFPAAFEPMTLNHMPAFLNEGERASFADGFGRWQTAFFPQFRKSETDLKERPFADGGYLDNRPFGYAVDTIQRRYGTRPVERKLLFIDPFPETAAAETASASEISFVDNIALAAMALPRYETIRGDIEAVQRHNAWVYRVDYLTRRIDGQIAQRTRALREQRGAQERALPDFAAVGLQEVLATYGDAYAAYHYAKLYAVSDELTRVIARAAGLDERSDLIFAVRRLVQAWRNANYCSELKDAQAKGAATENRFLLELDLGYRARRLNYLRQLIEASLGWTPEQADVPILLQLPEGTPRAPDESERAWLTAVHTAIGRGLDALHRLRQRLCALGSDNPLAPVVQRLMTDSEGLPAGLVDLVDEPDRAAADRRAQRLFASHRARFEAVAEQVRTAIREGCADPASGQPLAGTVAVNHAVSAAIAEGAPDDSPLPDRLRDIYRYGYDLRESLRYPLLGGEDDGEGSEVGIFRVSPLDARSLWDEATQARKTKLAGVALGAFGGFLDRTWRKNDILWGRLDGAERIIAALMPGDAWKTKRQAFIDRAHCAILREYLTAWREELAPVRHRDPAAAGRWAMLDELVGLLPADGATAPPDWKRRFRELYQVEQDLDRRMLLRHAGRTSSILASMLDRLKGSHERFGAANAQAARVLTRLGQSLLALVEISIPQGWASLIFRQWLKVLGVVGAFLTALALLLPPFAEARTPGVLLLGLVLVGWGLQDLVTRFARRWRPPRWVRWGLGALVAVVVAAALLAAATLMSNFDAFARLFAESLRAMLGS
ncbi:MAG: patatin-like protein [Chromatiaceae bacterium]|jgi:patatin-related protein|nr:patatin-like protein [Chromatiaceae bacterium]